MSDHYHEQREKDLIFSEFYGKKFDVIYADPAWSFNSKKNRRFNEVRSKPKV